MSPDPPYFRNSYATVDSKREKSQQILCIVNVEKGVVEPLAHLKNHFFTNTMKGFKNICSMGQGSHRQQKTLKKLIDFCSQEKII